MIKKIIILLMSNAKLLFCKLIHLKSFSFHPYNNISLSSSIEITKKGKISIGKKACIRKNTRISSCGGDIVIGSNCGINRNCYIVSHNKIIIGKNVLIGPNVVVVDHDHKIKDGKVLFNTFDTDPIIISDGAWIGANSIILKGAKIGKNSVIAAGSVVNKLVPDNSIFVQKRKSDILTIGVDR